MGRVSHFYWSWANLGGCNAVVASSVNVHALTWLEHRSDEIGVRRLGGNPCHEVRKLLFVLTLVSCLLSSTPYLEPSSSLCRETMYYSPPPGCF